VSDRLLWQRSRLTNAPEDAAARFLDLAAFADGLLDEEDRERVAALLARDPDAAADVANASALCGAGQRSTDQRSAGIERIIARPCALVPDGAAAPGSVVAFTRQRRRIVHDFARWGSLAAALVMASWLGFAMGTDTSLALSEPRQPS